MGPSEWLGVSEGIDLLSFMKLLLWNEKKGVRKYYLVNWETVCQPIDQ
jgi:hypothetical protein